MKNNLLPPNSTRLERATAATCACLGALPTPIRVLWQPSVCPLTLLPYLAWTLSVDRWDTHWPPALKRRVTQAAVALHQRKGTICALRHALEPLGYRLDFQEWWQCVPEEAPGTFRLRLSVLSTGITDDRLREIERLIDDAKPLSRHLLSVTLVLASHGLLRVGCISIDGETLTVYPYTPALLFSGGGLAVRGAPHLIDQLNLYP